LAPQSPADKKIEKSISALYIGLIFIIIAIVYIIHIHQNLWGSIVNFFSTLVLAQVPGVYGLTLPAPVNPAIYTDLYFAAFQFALGVGILEIIVLLLRVRLHSPVTRKAETVENLTFWLGTSYLIISYLVNLTIQSEWFVFWTGIVLIAGLSLVARAFVLFANKQNS
jgi:hypothetical protein